MTGGGPAVQVMPDKIRQRLPGLPGTERRHIQVYPAVAACKAPPGPPPPAAGTPRTRPGSAPSRRRFHSRRPPVSGRPHSRDRRANERSGGTHDHGEARVPSPRRPHQAAVARAWPGTSAPRCRRSRRCPTAAAGPPHTGRSSCTRPPVTTPSADHRGPGTERPGVHPRSARATLPYAGKRSRMPRSCSSGPARWPCSRPRRGLRQRSSPLSSCRRCRCPPERRTARQHRDPAKAGTRCHRPAVSRAPIPAPPPEYAHGEFI